MIEQFYFDFFISLLYVFVGYGWLLISKSNSIKNSLKLFKYKRTDKERNQLNRQSLIVVFRSIIFGFIVHYITYPVSPNDAPLFGSIIIGASSLSAINVCIINNKIGLKSKSYDEEEWQEYYEGLKKSYEFQI